MSITAMLGGSTCLNKAFCHLSLRSFSLSSSKNGPYETLNVPRNASRAAIKANFYKLSKKYHPDVNRDPDAKSKFQSVSEAWSILGDDRKRREYDRQLQSSSSSSPLYDRSSYSQSGHSGYSYYDESYTTRRRGATYAWEYTYARRTSRAPPPHSGQSRTRPTSNNNPFGGTFRSGTVGDDMWWPFSSGASTGRTGTSDWQDPFSSVHVRRATGRGSPNADGNATQTRKRQRQQWTTTHEEPWSDEDRLKKESVVVRIAQVIGLLFFIVLLGGGFR